MSNYDSYKMQTGFEFEAYEYDTDKRNKDRDRYGAKEKKRQKEQEDWDNVINTRAESKSNKGYNKRFDIKETKFWKKYLGSE